MQLTDHQFHMVRNSVKTSMCNRSCQSNVINGWFYISIIEFQCKQIETNASKLKSTSRRVCLIRFRRVGPKKNHWLIWYAKVEFRDFERLRFVRSKKNPLITKSSQFPENWTSNSLMLTFALVFRWVRGDNLSFEFKDVKVKFTSFDKNHMTAAMPSIEKFNLAAQAVNQTSSCDITLLFDCATYVTVTVFNSENFCPMCFFKL